jgi:hypothetical protein
MSELAAEHVEIIKRLGLPNSKKARDQRRKAAATTTNDDEDNEENEDNEDTQTKAGKKQRKADEARLEWLEANIIDWSQPIHKLAAPFLNQIRQVLLPQGP